MANAKLLIVADDFAGGLPIVRVSVDRGTAFDQAGSGQASPSSLINAIGCAARLAARRKEKRA